MSGSRPLRAAGSIGYFDSKSDLYAGKGIGVSFFTDPEWKSCWEGVEVDLTSTDAVGPQVIRAYLSRASTLRT